MSQEIKLAYGEKMPLEMHKVRIVQKLNLPKVEDRYNSYEELIDEINTLLSSY